MPKFQVTPGEAGVKLQIFLAGRLGCSVRRVKRLIDHNHCRVNGRLERFGSSALQAGDEIQLALEEEWGEPKILFEDPYLKVLDKPAGLILEGIHRLDRDTSGILLMAKGDPSPFQKLFAERKMGKTYLALVHGVPKQQGRVENRLGPCGFFEGQTIWGEDPGGKVAKTSWRVLRSGKEWAFLEARPETGRTHQIRVHLAALGHPIVGDGQYGREISSSLETRRHLLHASRLRFIHPMTRKEIDLHAPLPKDFQRVLDACSDC